MWFYWALADYGRSFVRPAAWLVASGFFFCWRYTEVLAQLMAKAPTLKNISKLCGCSHSVTPCLSSAHSLSTPRSKDFYSARAAILGAVFGDFARFAGAAFGDGASF